MQSLEMLIAAHDLEMIHSDPKPPNIKLTCIPPAYRKRLVSDCRHTRGFRSCCP